MIASEIRDEPREFARTAKVLQLAHQPTQSEKVNSALMRHYLRYVLLLDGGQWGRLLLLVGLSLVCRWLLCCLRLILRAFHHF